MEPGLKTEAGLTSGVDSFDLPGGGKAYRSVSDNSIFARSGRQDTPEERKSAIAGLAARAYGAQTGTPQVMPVIPEHPRLVDERGNRLEHYANVGGGTDIEGRLRAEAELARPLIQEGQIKAELEKNRRAIEDPYRLGQRTAEAAIEAQKQGLIAASKGQADAYVARVKEAARYERSDQVLEDELAGQLAIIDRAPASEEAKAAARANEMRKYTERKKQFARIGLAHGYPKSEFEYEDQPQAAPEKK